MAHDMVDYRLGCTLPAEQWAQLNRVGVFEDPSLAHFVGTYPPPELMQHTTGLTDQRSFASHGADLWLALSKASPGKLSGGDVYSRHAAWCTETLTYMDAKLFRVDRPVPFADNQFEAIISISIFSHLSDSRLLLQRLDRNRLVQSGHVRSDGVAQDDIGMPLLIEIDDSLQSCKVVVERPLGLGLAIHLHGKYLVLYPDGPRLEDQSRLRAWRTFRDQP